MEHADPWGARGFAPLIDRRWADPCTSLASPSCDAFERGLQDCRNPKCGRCGNRATALYGRNGSRRYTDPLGKVGLSQSRLDSQRAYQFSVNHDSPGSPAGTFRRRENFVGHFDVLQTVVADASTDADVDGLLLRYALQQKVLPQHTIRNVRCPFFALERR